MGLSRVSASTCVAGAAALLAAAAAGTGAATLRNPFLVAAAVLVAAFVALAFRSTAAAIALFVACTFVEQIPGAGAGLTLVKAMGAIVAVAWAFGLLRDGSASRTLGGERTLVTFAAVTLLGWSLISAAWAVDARTAVHSGLRLAQGVLLVIVMVSCLRTVAALRAALAAFVAGACLSAILGLAGVGATPTSAPAATARIGGGLGDPNYLAAVLVGGIFFALGLRATTRNRPARALLVAAPILMIVALVKTESRGGVVALAAGVLAAVLLEPRLRRQVLTAALAVLVGGAVYLGFFASSHRLISFGGGGSGRTELWSVALRVSGNHPIGGVGAGNFPVVEGSYAATISRNLSKPYLEVTTHEVAHNTYLHVLAELGLVGLLLLAVLLLGALQLGRRAASAFEALGEPALATLASSLVVGAIGLFVAFAFLTAQYEKQLWIAIGLLAAANGVALPRIAPAAIAAARRARPLASEGVA